MCRGLLLRPEILLNHKVFYRTSSSDSFLQHFFSDKRKSSGKNLDPQLFVISRQGCRGSTWNEVIKLTRDITLYV